MTDTEYREPDATDWAAFERVLDYMNDLNTLTLRAAGGNGDEGAIKALSMVLTAISVVKDDARSIRDLGVS